MLTEVYWSELLSKCIQSFTIRLDFCDWVSVLTYQYLCMFTKLSDKVRWLNAATGVWHEFCFLWLSESVLWNFFAK